MTNLKKILLPVIFVLLGVFVADPVSASFSPYYEVVSRGSYYSAWQGLSEYQHQDGSYYTVNGLPATSYYGSARFNTPEVSKGSRINSVEVIIHARNRYGGTPTVNLEAYVAYDDLAVSAAFNSGGRVTSLGINTTSWANYSFYSSNSEGNTELVDYINAHGGYDQDKFVLIFGDTVGSGTNSQLIDIDYIKIRFNFDKAEFVNITNFIASPSAGLNTMDLSGDTGTKSADMLCRINVFEICTAVSKAGFTSEVPVAVVNLDPTATNSSTIKQSGNTWLGHGFSPTSSVWYAEGVTVPYEQGYTCQYPTQTLCTTPIMSCDETGCTQTGTTVNIDEHNANLTQYDQTGLLSEPEPSNPLAWVVWKFRQMLYNELVPNFSLTQEAVLTTQQSLQTRAPFAYVYALSNLNLSSVATISSFTIAFPVLLGSTRSYVNATLPSQFNDVASVFKGFMSIVVYGALVMYLFRLSRRVL